MVVIVTGYTLSMTSYSRLQTNVLVKLVDTICILFYTSGLHPFLYNRPLPVIFALSENVVLF